MTDFFEHIDHDRDRLQVVPRTWRGQDGYMVRVYPAQAGGRAVAAFVPAPEMERLARRLLQVAEPRETELLAGPTFDTVARAEYALGDLTVLVEGAPGDTSEQVANALRRLLVDVTAEGGDEAAELLADLAEALDVPESDLRDAVRDAKETILGQDQTIGQLTSEAEQAQQALNMTVRQRDDNARGWAAARARITQLDQLLADERGGAVELRRGLAALGLQSMSTAPFSEVAARIKRLGDENNELRERLSAEGMLTAKTTLSAQTTELAELREALRLVNAELTAARQAKRDEHVAAGARAAELQGALTKANARADALQAAITEAAADLTAHAGPNDELDVRVLGRLMNALNA